MDSRAGGSEHAASLLALHQLAGAIDSASREVIPVEPGIALQTLADAAPDEVPLSARISVLHALAKNDLPGFDEHEPEYHAIAASIGDTYGLSSEQVIADLKQAVADPTTFDSSSTGSALPHETTAFMMEDVCNTASVVVDGKSAAWVFSEFETDASFEDVAEWVNPINWPQRSPLMFKQMFPIDGGPDPLPAGVGGTSFHGTYHEEVQLIDRLNTLLHCDFVRIDGVYAGMTYELDRSLDNEIVVDRGFLLVNELGDTRHVKALKVVGFTETGWNDVAQWVCPIWTDFVRGAVRGGSVSTPVPQPDDPPGAGTGVVADWIQFLRTTIDDYVDMGVEFVTDVGAGDYTPSRLVQDGAQYWLKVARDWSRASALGYSSLQKMAGGAGIAPELDDLAAPFVQTLGQPAAVGRGEGEAAVPPSRPDTEGTTLPVLSLKPDESVSCGDLARVGESQNVIRGSSVTAAPIRLSGGVLGIHIEAPTSQTMPGMYVGQATVGANGNQRQVPVQLYVSRARRRS